MRLDVAQESSFMAHSKRLDISFSTLILRYVLEGVMQQVESSAYKDVLWMSRDELSGKEEGESNASGRLVFFYIESEKKIPEDRLIAGQVMSEPLLRRMLDELFAFNKKIKIQWTLDKYEIQAKKAIVQMTGEIEQIPVPLELRFYGITARDMAPQRKSISSVIDERRKITYLVYPTEEIVVERFVEIMTKLELIADMEAYGQIDDILKEQSVSGRYVISELEEYAQVVPNFRKEKRMDQLRKYRNYPYMRKRWEKYAKHRDRSGETWEEVIERILGFAEPIWQAFCRDEIFLDDWMPELGRFLG